MTPASTEPAATPATSARAWEYLTVPVVGPPGFEDAAGIEGYHAALNEYGGQGWERVGVAGYPGKSVEGSILVLFFKRPVG
ncbi:MAG TPA: DUF4177 domain-containing protein [Gemmataceae bacterium]|nr:DUF4177 domain-containing protein [Gemmataceae bacterium]